MSANAPRAPVETGALQKFRRLETQAIALHAVTREMLTAPGSAEAVVEAHRPTAPRRSRLRRAAAG